MDHCPDCKRLQREQARFLGVGRMDQMRAAEDNAVLSLQRFAARTGINLQRPNQETLSPRSRELVRRFNQARRDARHLYEEVTPVTERVPGRVRWAVCSHIVEESPERIAPQVSHWFSGAPEFTVCERCAAQVPEVCHDCVADESVAGPLTHNLYAGTGGAVIAHMVLCDDCIQRQGLADDERTFR